MSATVRCGFAAILDPARSIHSETVLRALQLFREMQSGLNIEFVLCEDYGSFEGGAHAADYLVSRGVDVVVGHYASNSALGALGFYAEHGVPLLLPSATDMSLTTGQGNAFRLCPHNQDIVEALLGQFSEGAEYGMQVYTDDSLYAQNLAGLLRATLAARAVPGNAGQPAPQILFIGTGSRSEEFLHACQARQVTDDFILTDDAACAQLRLPTEFAAGQVRGVGFAPPSLVNPTSPYVIEYQRRYGEPPGVFFLETLAALEVAGALRLGQIPANEQLNQQTFDTCLGALRFERGEQTRANLCLWLADAGQRLQPVELIRTIRE
ncbi:ABC transporter substrate-binding protein [Pseudomonas putida]|uniref:ABC transporter substrate-binding protein n=1 Tax=Pseudomonas putida TaxID=303 RepID=UPI0034D6E011